MDTFGAFYQANREKLFFYLMRLTGDYYLAGDIMQESFTRMLTHYGPGEKKVSLLFTIARNAVWDESRKAKKTTEPGDHLPDDAVDSERQLLVRQEYQNVLSAMQKLEKTERDVLALAAAGDFSYREIAGMAKISEANVRVKVHRARVKLKKILQQEDDI